MIEGKENASASVELGGGANMKSLLLSIIPSPTTLSSNKQQNANISNSNDGNNGNSSSSFHSSVDLGAHGKMISLISSIIECSQIVKMLPPKLTKEQVDYLPLIGDSSYLGSAIGDLRPSTRKFQDLEDVPTTESDDKSVVEMTTEKMNDHDVGQVGGIDDRNTGAKMKEHAPSAETSSTESSSSSSHIFQKERISLPKKRENPVTRLNTLKSLITSYSKAIEKLKSYEPLYLTLPDIPQYALSTSDDEQRMKEWLTSELQDRIHWKKTIKDLKKEVEQLKNLNAEKLKRNDTFLKAYSRIRQNMIPPNRFNLFPQHIPKSDLRAKYLCNQLLSVYSNLLFAMKPSPNPHIVSREIQVLLEGDFEKAKQHRNSYCLHSVVEDHSGSTDPSTHDVSSTDIYRKDREDISDEYRQVKRRKLDGPEDANITDPVQTSDIDALLQSNVSGEIDSHAHNRISSPSEHGDDVELYPLAVVLKIPLEGLKNQPRITFRYSIKHGVVLASIDNWESGERSGLYGSDILSTLYRGDTGDELPRLENSPSSAFLGTRYSAEEFRAKEGRPYIWAQILSNGKLHAQAPTTTRHLFDIFSAEDLIQRVKSNMQQFQRLEKQIDQIIQKGKAKFHGSESAVGHLSVPQTTKHYTTAGITLESTFNYHNQKDRSMFNAQVHVFVQNTHDNPKFSIRLLDMKVKSPPFPSIVTSSPHFKPELLSHGQRLKLESQLKDIEIYMNSLPTPSCFSGRFSQLGKCLNAFFATFHSSHTSYLVDNQPVGIRIAKYTEFGVDSAKCFRWSESENVFRPL